MPMRDLDRLIGLSISADRAAEALSLLGFAVTLKPDAIEALVPYWRRVDIAAAPMSASVIAPQTCGHG